MHHVVVDSKPVALERGPGFQIGFLHIWIVMLAWGCGWCQPTSWLAANQPDMIVTRGRLFGADDPTATAIAIRGNRITAVGSDQEIEQLAGPSTRRVDAAGHSVTPGIHDAHVHFLSGSLSLEQVDLSAAQSVDDIRKILSDYQAGNRGGAVVVGRGWLYGTFPGGLPSKELLDELVPNRPAVMRCYDGHTVWVNTRALQAAGITNQTPDPPAGIIVRDATGQATGVLKESAQTLIDKIIPQPTKADKLNALRTGIAHAHRLGVTSVCEAGIGLPELELLDDLQTHDELRLRYAIALEGKANMPSSEIDGFDGLKRRYPALQIQAVKLYVDGVIESHTAALLAPYANRPTIGLPETTPEELNRVVGELDARGWQIMVHAIGDGGVRMTLDALERATKANAAPSRGRRHRLEHIETISQQDIGRLGELRVIASMQPYHANPNSNIFNVWAANLGPDRASRAWAWGSIAQRGGRLAFGSDWPVVSLDPRLGMHTALTRQTLNGQPPGGFIPSQRLPLSQVLAAYTRDAAYAQFADHEQGALQAGMLADVVLWDCDLFQLPVDRVSTARVRMTIFNGRTAYGG